MAWSIASKKRRGAVLVEFALIVPLLIMLLLGILEFGVMVMHQLTLEQAAREGSRLAAVRNSVTSVTERITNSASTLPNQEELQIVMAYSTDNGQSFPYTLADTAGGENDAPPGSLVQVSINWPHHLVTGSFFGWLTGAENNTVPLRTEVVMRRE
jgi:Flp pilus assembly protein TadG